MVMGRVKIQHRDFIHKRAKKRRARFSRPSFRKYYSIARDVFQHGRDSCDFDYFFATVGAVTAFSFSQQASLVAAFALSTRTFSFTGRASASSAGLTVKFNSPLPPLTVTLPASCSPSFSCQITTS